MNKCGCKESYSCKQQQHSEFDVFPNNNLKCTYFSMKDYMFSKMKENYGKNAFNLMRTNFQIQNYYEHLCLFFIVAFTAFNLHY